MDINHKFSFCGIYFDTGTFKINDFSNLSFPLFIFYPLQTFLLLNY